MGAVDEARAAIHAHVAALVTVAEVEAFADGLLYQGLFPMGDYTPKQIREMAPKALAFLRAHKPSTPSDN